MDPRRRLARKQRPILVLADGECNTVLGPGHLAEFKVKSARSGPETCAAYNTLIVDFARTLGKNTMDCCGHPLRVYAPSLDVECTVNLGCRDALQPCGLRSGFRSCWHNKTNPRLIAERNAVGGTLRISAGLTVSKRWHCYKATGETAAGWHASHLSRLVDIAADVPRLDHQFASDRSAVRHPPPRVLPTTRVDY
jgi:hypothetical protein